MPEKKRRPKLEEVQGQFKFAMRLPSGYTGARMEMRREDRPRDIGHFVSLSPGNLPMRFYSA